MSTADFRSLIESLSSTTGVVRRSEFHPVRRVAVLGAGVVGQLLAVSALAADLQVTLYSVYGRQLGQLGEDGGITVRGTDLVGTYAVGEPSLSKPAIRLSHEVDDAVAGADVVFLATPSSAHPAFASMLAPILVPETLVVLVPGRFMGVTALHHELVRHRGSPSTTLAELSTPPYIADEDGSTIRVHGAARQVEFATLPLEAAAESAQRLAPMLPMLTPVDSPLVTAFSSVAAIVTAVPMLTNVRALDARGDASVLVRDLVTPTLAATLLSQLDSERLEVAFRYGVRELHDAAGWLRATYGTDDQPEDFAEAVDLRETLSGLKAFDELNLSTTSASLLTDEIPDSLVPLSQTGRQAGVPTPATDTAIALASCLLGSDQTSVGRGLERVGLAGVRPAGAHQHLAQLRSRAAGASGAVGELTW